LQGKGFEVLSEGEGQATTWDRGTMARVKKRVLALDRGTNQAMRSHVVSRIKILVEVTWSHWSELLYMEMV